MEEYCHEIYRNFDYGARRVEYFVSANIPNLKEVMKKIQKYPEKILAIDIGEKSKTGLIRAELNERLFLRSHESKYIIYDGPVFSRNFGKSYVVKGPLINPKWIRKRGVEVRKNQAFIEVNEGILRGIAQNEIDLFFQSKFDEMQEEYRSELARRFIECLAMDSLD